MLFFGDDVLNFKIVTFYIFNKHKGEHTGPPLYLIG